MPAVSVVAELQMTVFRTIRDLLAPLAVELGPDYRLVCGVNEEQHLFFSIYKCKSEQPCWTLKMDSDLDYDLDPELLLKQFLESARAWFEERPMSTWEDVGVKQMQ